MVALYTGGLLFMMVVVLPSPSGRRGNWENPMHSTLSCSAVILHAVCCIQLGWINSKNKYVSLLYAGTSQFWCLGPGTQPFPPDVTFLICGYLVTTIVNWNTTSCLTVDFTAQEPPPGVCRRGISSAFGYL
ncbi:hypothetical protein GGR57DRAFT_457442 [Xylariaceae sp. FL1272]|nr:hypothetical protein GGR57DRAFT_457442 [Xylariaceae sp. FL1272]